MKIPGAAVLCGAAAAVLFAVSGSDAQVGSPADETLASLPGTAWEGAYDVTVGGLIKTGSIPIRLVNADRYEADGRLGYHFAMPANHSDLSEVISASEPRDSAKCVQDAGLSSERFTSVHGDGKDDGVYSGQVFLAWKVFDERTRACEPVQIPLTIKSFTVTKAWPRRSLTIEMNPKPGDWKNWLKELNP